ncbi:CoA binding domain-containing protein [Xylariomycetidae sp. FL2044]|nr:CoA binding domain-containing protein [Xylariomycetidae sp. FL2044]
MSTEATVRAFFSSPKFAVVGASTNPAKFGHKVFTWYHDHQLPVVPINPVAPSITTPYGAHPTTKSLADLPDPKNTSVSIITPAPATMEVLREAKKLGIPAVWLQPGTWDDEVLLFARGQDGYEGEVVAGDGGYGHGGWCVLVDGERGLRGVGKL